MGWGIHHHPVEQRITAGMAKLNKHSGSFHEVLRTVVEGLFCDRCRTKQCTVIDRDWMHRPYPLQRLKAQAVKFSWQAGGDRSEGCSYQPD